MSETYQIKLQEIDRALELSPDQHLEFRAHRDIIERILKLREEKNVLILGHNYMAPLVYQLSGETERGDSLALSRFAAQSEHPIILFDGVRFMAETAKILSPDKKVLIADMSAGCSLADPFYGKDVVAMKEQYPGAPVVTYVNSYAEVKAESDYCCTSSNGKKVILHAAKDFQTDRVIFIPDSLMGNNLQREIQKEGHQIDVIYPGKYDDKYGSCEVHEKLKADDIRNVRQQFNMPKNNPSTAIIVHWECPPEVLEESDHYGSTSDMIRFLHEHPDLEKVYLGTECEMTANLANEFPQIEFVRTCQMFCEHMGKITLEKILHSLENEVYEVHVPEEIRIRALTSLERMLSIH